LGNTKERDNKIRKSPMKKKCGVVQKRKGRKTTCATDGDEWLGVEEQK